MSEPASAFLSSCPNHPEVTAGLAPCARCGQELCPSCLISLQGRLVCATCKPEVLRDVISNTTAALDLAGPGKRFAGAFVDGLLLFAVSTAVTAAAVFTTSFARGGAGGSIGTMAAAFLLSPLLWFLYDGLMTASGGQTLGKKLAGTKVVTPEGGEITTGAAWLRAGSRVVMGLTRVLGLVDALFVYSDRRRTLHDRIAKTVVVNWQG